MALITDILARCARQCSVPAPSSWLTTTAPGAVSLRDDYMLETAEDILDRCDLPYPVSDETTITGTGATDYALPADFLRAQRGAFAVQESTGSSRRIDPLPDDGDWSYFNQTGNVGADRIYRITGYPGAYRIWFLRTLATGETARVNYVTTHWMATTGGTAGSAFTADTDVALVPRRLLETGIVYRFRQRRGLNYEDKFLEYERVMARYAQSVRGIKRIEYGASQPRSPWDIPVPDTIPST